MVEKRRTDDGMVKDDESVEIDCVEGNARGE